MSQNKLNYDNLLHSYLSLWNNRSLAIEQDSETTLKNAIKRELKDEYSHPRVRTTPHVKFYLGAKRILTSSLSEIEQLQLLSVYKEMMELLLNEKKPS